MDGITEEDIPETLRGEACMPDTAPSTLEFKTVIKFAVSTKPALSVAERIHDVKMGVADQMHKSGWRRAVHQRITLDRVRGAL